jgi:ammonia channel protein AmtB
MELKALHKQKSTWAGIAAIIATVGTYFTTTPTPDVGTLISGIVGGLVLIFMQEFKK